MDNGDRNSNRWVEERLAQLEPDSEWRPNSEKALSRLRIKGRTAKVRRRWVWAMMGCSLLAIRLVGIPACQAASCAAPAEDLAGRLWKAVFPAKTIATPAAATGTAAERMPPTVPIEPEKQERERSSTALGVIAKAERPVHAAVTASTPGGRAAEPTSSPWNFKESGSASAPITCEIYSDYECPGCAQFFFGTLPKLVADYVDTGKVKLVHRDVTLPMHAHARLAARYANAAGQTGHYDVVVRQIFQTQGSWSGNGDIDAQVADVLSPEAMESVRELVKNEPRLDDTVDADMNMARGDQIRMTPSLVVVWKGKRQVIAPISSYELVKQYLDGLLARQ
jgi:protein-disulfide isomerase